MQVGMRIFSEMKLEVLLGLQFVSFHFITRQLLNSTISRANYGSSMHTLPERADTDGYIHEDRKSIVNRSITRAIRENYLLSI